MKYLSLIFIVTLFTNCAMFTSVSTSSQSSDSISTSLSSVSTGLKSVSSLSQSLASISGSSLSDEKDDKKSEALYRSDMKMITYLTIKNGGENFLSQIERLSNDHGIIDWTRNKNSFFGIGEGMAKAGVSPSEVKDFLSTNSLSIERKNWISEGFLGK